MWMLRDFLTVPSPFLELDRCLHQILTNYLFRIPPGFDISLFFSGFPSGFSKDSDFEGLKRFTITNIHIQLYIFISLYFYIFIQVCVGLFFSILGISFRILSPDLDHLFALESRFIFISRMILRDYFAFFLSELIS